MKRTMKRTMFKQLEDRWCEVTVDYHDARPAHPERLSICGSYGRVVSRAAAKREAFESWKSYFEDDSAELGKFAARFRIRATATACARKVVEVDGELHGVDVHREEAGKVFVCEASGQIQDKIRTFFPELEPFLKFHLNDMHAECPHQEARGETWEKNPSAVCPDCGYVFGSQWLARKLPDEVRAWAIGDGKAA